MVQRCYGRGFPSEALEDVLVVEKIRRSEFQANGALNLGVFGPVDEIHAVPQPSPCGTDGQRDEWIAGAAQRQD